MQRRILVLPLSALVIAGLCAYKLSRSDERADGGRGSITSRQAPRFVLPSQEPPQSVRLESFLGRHEIVLVFFDEDVGFRDPVLSWLRQRADYLRKENVKVFAISGAIPQVHRQMLEDALGTEEPIPFPLLTDLDGKVHAQYGLSFENALKRPTAVFFIDRAGNVSWDGQYPAPLEEPLTELERKLGG